jgi:hypothetical protein
VQAADVAAPAAVRRDAFVGVDQVTAAVQDQLAAVQLPPAADGVTNGRARGRPRRRRSPVREIAVRLRHGPASVAAPVDRQHDAVASAVMAQQVVGQLTRGGRRQVGSAQARQGFMQTGTGIGPRPPRPGHHVAGPQQHDAACA